MPLPTRKRTYMSEYGRIGVEWRTEDGHFHMKAEIPCNLTALVRLPDGTSREAQAAGHMNLNA